MNFLLNSVRLILIYRSIIQIKSYLHIPATAPQTSPRDIHIAPDPPCRSQRQLRHSQDGAFVHQARHRHKRG